MLKRRKILILTILMALAFASVAHAALQVGPIDPASVWPVAPAGTPTGFPAYYMDSTGIALDLIPITGNGVTPPTQIYTPPDPANPYSAYLGFESEAFYYFARNLFSTKYGKATATFGIEASFVNGVAKAGEEMVFVRIRLRAAVRDVGTYTFIHPWGTETIPVTQADINAKKDINFTRDVGLVPRAFDLAASGPIQLFAKQLVPTPPVGWIGDGTSVGTITPGPTGINYVKLTGPAGIDLDGRKNNFVQSNLFTISGRVLVSTAIPSALSVQRATCLDTTAGEYIDVFVTSDPTATVTVSGTAVQPTTLVGDGAGKFYAHAQGTGIHGAGSFPITVTAATTGAAVTTTTANVVDMVNIFQATYSVSLKTLTVTAISSDAAAILTLANSGLNVVNTGLTATTVSVPFGVPPATVTVTSTMGGSDTQPVTILQ